MRVVFLIIQWQLQLSGWLCDVVYKLKKMSQLSMVEESKEFNVFLCGYNGCLYR